MSTDLHTNLHQCHRETMTQDAFWRDQIAEWQAELKQMIDELPEIEKTLRQHAQALEDHAASIGADETAVSRHEAALAEYERGGQGEDLISMARSHGTEIGRHQQHEDAHERIRRHHYGLCAKWKLLRKAIGEAM